MYATSQKTNRKSSQFSFFCTRTSDDNNTPYQLSEAQATLPPEIIPDYPLPTSERVEGGNVSLSPMEIRQHKKAISEGEYPQNSIRHNFLYGKENLPAPTNIPRDIYKDSYTSESVTGNFLHAVDQLTSYSGGKPMYRGTMVSAENFENLQPGNILQSHQLSFFSENNLVSRAFIDSSSRGDLIPVLFEVKNVPDSVFKEGILSPAAYDDLRERMLRKGVNAKKMTGIGSTSKEIIAVPGTLFKVIKTKQIKSDIHKHKLTQVELKYIGVSKGVHDKALF